MAEQKDGGAAFPVQGWVLEDGTPSDDGKCKSAFFSGMTLRDYFAAKAMQGIIAAEGTEVTCPEAGAKRAYRIADALIAHRDREK